MDFEKLYALLTGSAQHAALIWIGGPVAAAQWLFNGGAVLWQREPHNLPAPGNHTATLIPVVLVIFTGV